MVSSAATPAAASAATPAVNLSDLVNSPAGQPAQERYPGPVDSTQYTDGGPPSPIQGPPQGVWVDEGFAGYVPTEAPGGGIQDTSWMTGTDGPQAPWDSSAGAPFAGSGALPPELHGADTGAVFAAQHVTPAEIGSLTRTTRAGQTYNREYAFDPVTGQNVPAANGRIDYDQRQVHDPAPRDGGGWAPWDPGYAERPILNNLAYQATPVTASGIQGVNGALPDRSQFSYSAAAYEAPPDPVVMQPAAPTDETAGGWVLG